MLEIDLGLFTAAATEEGLWTLLDIGTKAYLSVLAMVLLSLTTRFHDLMWGLHRLRLPGLLCLLISSLYRYMFLVIDQVWRMRRAADARNLGARSGGARARVMAGMIGSLFIRSYERAERIYLAMLARGFDGEARPLLGHGVGAADLWFAAAGGVVMLVVALALP